MPLLHAEDLELQRESVRRYTALRDSPEVSASAWTTFDRFCQIAKRHAEHIDHFGRFPERNALLGRQSTPPEVIFLKSTQIMRPAFQLN